MEKSPDSRYATARDMCDDLRRFIEDLPLAARRPSPIARTGKFIRRRKALSAAMLSTVLLVVVGAYVVSLRAQRATVMQTRIGTLQQEADKAIEGGRYEDAIALLTEFLGLGIAIDDRSDALYNRAVAAKNLFASNGGKDPRLIDDALADANALLTLDQNATDSWNLKGVLLKILQRFSEAKEAYQRALKLAPDDSATLINVAAMDAVLNHDIEAAKQNLNKATSTQDTRDARIQSWRGLAAIQLLEHDATALDSLDEALADDEVDYACHLLRARAIILLGESGTETDAFRDAVLANFQSSTPRPLVKRLLAQAHLNMAQWEKARQYAESALQLGGQPYLNHFILAIATANLGDSAAAKDHLTDAEDAWPPKLATPGDFIASADEGVLWFETYDELASLKKRAEQAINAILP